MARTAETTFKEFRRRYNSEDACRAELFRLRFSNGYDWQSDFPALNQSRRYILWFAELSR